MTHMLLGGFGHGAAGAGTKSRVTYGVLQEEIEDVSQLCRFFLLFSTTHLSFFERFLNTPWAGLLLGARWRNTSGTWRRGKGATTTTSIA